MELNRSVLIAIAVVLGSVSYAGDKMKAVKGVWIADGAAMSKFILDVDPDTPKKELDDFNKIQRYMVLISSKSMTVHQVSKALLKYEGTKLVHPLTSIRVKGKHIYAKWKGDKWRFTSTGKDTLEVNAKCYSRFLRRASKAEQEAFMKELAKTEAESK